MNYEKEISIIGSGPRGISILDRIVENSKEFNINVNINIFDKVNIGGGKVWDENQNKDLLMNTLPSELTIFSSKDNGQSHNLDRLSFCEWISKYRKDLDCNTYQPRYVYGQYLSYAFDKIVEGAGSFLRINKHEVEVIDIELQNEGFIISLENERIYSDFVALATGHEYNKDNEVEEEVNSFAKKNSLNYYPEGYVADYDFEKIPEKSSVGILGLGLNFYDTISLLTIGRGGRFIRRNDNTLEYKPSGNEPKIFAGSRTGMPSRARAVNQKSVGRSVKSYFLSRLSSLSNMSFTKQIYPAIEAEVNFNFLIQKAGLKQEAIEFLAERVYNSLGSFSFESLAHVIGVENFKKIELEKIYNPFKDVRDNYTFQKLILTELQDDVYEANLGNVDSKLKNSIDLLRDLRGVIRSCVEFDKISSSDFPIFQRKFKPIHSSLVAGPPVNRVEELISLIKAGVVNFIGPNTEFGLDADKGDFVLSSSLLDGGSYNVKSLIVARTPGIDLKKYKSTLFSSLLKKGLITECVKVFNGGTYHTGGINISKESLNPISKDNSIVNNMYITGIPIESSKFFTQTAGTNPAKWNDIIHDSELIAKQIMISIDALRNVKIESLK